MNGACGDIISYDKILRVLEFSRAIKVLIITFPVRDIKWSSRDLSHLNLLSSFESINSIVDYLYKNGVRP